MRPVVPDVGLWAQMGEFFGLLGGLQAVVLLACVAGVVLAALAWAAGHSLGMARLSSGGKVGVAVSIATAFCAAALPSLMGWLISVFVVG